MGILVSADHRRSVRGFAVVHAPEGDEGKVAVWHVAYGGRLAGNANAVVLDRDDPARKQKLDSLLSRQFVLGTEGTGLGRPVQDVCQLLVDEAMKLGQHPDIVPPVKRDPRSDSPAHQALAAADNLALCWNFWLKTARRFTPQGEDVSLLPAAVIEQFTDEPVALVGSGGEG